MTPLLAPGYHPFILFLLPLGFLIVQLSGPELMAVDYPAYGITGIPTAIASPHLNAYAEWFVRSVRREGLDLFIIMNQRQLSNIVHQYVDYYTIAVLIKV